MFSISCLRLALFILFVEATKGYQITAETKIEEFPVQEPNFSNGKTFFRISNGTKEEVTCPWGHEFDRKVNYCVKTSSGVEPRNLDGECLKLGLPQGDHSNPDSCESFYKCDSVCCYLMHCGDHLLFNVVQDRCLYPYEASCCEYVEKNPDKLVQ